MALVRRLEKGSPLTAAEHDANLDYLESLQSLVANTPWYLVSGLTYNVTGNLIPIAGVGYTAPSTNITLDAADPDDPRFDVIIGTNLGTIIKRTGVPSAAPAIPDVDEASEYLIATIQVLAGATTGSGINVGDIYRENTEWTTTENTAAARINTASTNDKYEGTVSIEASSPINGDAVLFTAPSSVNVSELSLTRFRLKLKAAMSGTSRLQIQFFNGSTAVSSLVNIYNGSFNFDNSDTVTFQDIVNTYADFNFSSNVVTAFKITQYGSCLGWYIDNVEYQNTVTVGSGTIGLLELKQEVLDKINAIKVDQLGDAFAKIIDLGNVSGTIDIDWSLAVRYKLNMTANTTLNFTNVTDYVGVKTQQLEVTSNSDTYILTHPTGVDVAGDLEDADLAETNHFTYFCHRLTGTPFYQSSVKVE